MNKTNYYLQLRILHIEDDPLVRSTVTRMLSRVSYADVHLVSVATLTRGLELIRDETWDCVLLDLTLPDCTGITTFHHIHALSDVPIVVFTAEPHLEARVAVVAAGAQDCLFKAEMVEPDTLLRSIRFAVERHRTVVELRHALRELERANQAMRDLLANSEFSYASPIEEDDDQEDEDERH